MRNIQLGFVLVCVAAILPRVWSLGTFITIDEANFWLRRSELFLGALVSGNYAATALSAHPGVTTMWLGSAGIVLRRMLIEWGLLTDLSFGVRLALLQLPVALTHAAAILGGYGLLRRLLSPAAALLGALLWALDPFLIGYSRLLHVDALATSFAAVSLLAALVCWKEGGARWAWGLFSAICAGLAVLSKLPALVLVPAVGLVVLWAVWGQGRSGLLLGLRWLIVWGLVLAATVLVLWPACWVSPLAAYQALREGVEVEGGQAHMMGNFFLGREVAAPGPLFYPTALALRLMPWTLLGLLLLPLALQRMTAEQRRTLALLATFALLMVAALSPFPKKFNRYALPAFPALDILAAAGIAGVAQRWANSDETNQQEQALPSTSHLQSSIFNLQSSIIGATVLASTGLVILVHPYEIAAFNPLLGGTSMGAQTFVVGWGEGYEQVAAWLNQQPEITGVVTVSAMTPTLQPYLRPGAQAVPPQDPLPNQAGYVVVYIEQVQRGNVLPPFDRFYGKQTPLHTVMVNGLEYAWIYQAPPLLATEREALFGDTIRLRGFSAGEVRAGQPLELRLGWEALHPPPSDYLLFVHLVGPDGQRVAQADLPPAEVPTSTWQPGRFPVTSIALPLPPTLPAGAYRLAIGLYDPASGQRLPLPPSLAADQATFGPHALVLMTSQR